MTSTNTSFLRGIFVLSLILLLGACAKPRTYIVTKTGFLIPDRVVAAPTGTKASIRIQEGARERRVEGELIEVRKDGLLILTTDTSELTLLSYSSMVRMRFKPDAGINRSVHGSRFHGNPAYKIPPLQEDQVRQRTLARFSRYPFGLDEVRLQRLLNVLGQSELVVIGSD